MHTMFLLLPPHSPTTLLCNDQHLYSPLIARRPERNTAEMPIAISPLSSHTTLTIFRGDSSPSAASSEPQAANDSNHMTPNKLVSEPVTAFDLLYPLLFLLLPILLALWRRSKNLRAQKAKIATAALLAARDPEFWTAWRTRDLPVLYGLTELYITGAFPLGPWDVSSLRAGIAKYRGHYLRRLCRAGIVPLYIQEHGLGTRKWPSVDEDTSRDTSARYGAVKTFGSKRAVDERPICSPEKMTSWKMGKAWWESVLDKWLPTYIQSKRRAYFDFLIPVPLDFDPNVDNHYMQDLFVRKLISKVGTPLHDFAISIWVSGLVDGRATMINTGNPDVALEYGATSHFKAFLPFKKDRVLREGTSWAENLRNVRRRLVDPFITPVEGEDMERIDEELRHDVHYYMKKGSIPILEVPPHTSSIRVAIIRIEKRDGSAPGIPLDEFVAQAAWDAGLCHRFSEQTIMGNTRSWLDERGFGDLPGIQQYLFTPAKAETATPQSQGTRTAGPALPTPREVLRRAEVQRLRTDRVIERARLAREMRQVRQEHQQEKSEPRNVQGRITTFVGDEVLGMQGIRTGPDILDSGLQDEVFDDILNRANVSRNEDFCVDENDPDREVYDDDL
jgi:hypothetical protein